MRVKQFLIIFNAFVSKMSIIYKYDKIIEILVKGLD